MAMIPRKLSMISNSSQSMTLSPKIPTSPSLSSHPTRPRFPRRNHRPKPPILHPIPQSASRLPPREQRLKPGWCPPPLSTLSGPFLGEKQMEMRAEDSREINGCLLRPSEYEAEGEEGPGVVLGGDIDDIDVDGGAGMETGPPVGDGDLEGGEVEAEGCDEAGECL